MTSDQKEKQEDVFEKRFKGSVYGHRNRPAYREYKERDYKSIAEYCKNPRILKWWNKPHDELIAKLIKEKQWYWYWYATEGILATAPPERIKSWRKKDPLCKKYAWYNVVMYFAISRAYSLGLTKRIRKAKWKNCKFCEQRFLENSLPLPLVELLGGIKQIKLCSPCITKAHYSENDNATRQETLSYLQDLTSIIQCIPKQGFGTAKSDLVGLNIHQKLKVLKVLKRKPTVSRVKKLFGSWLNALVEADILEEGVHKTSRGVRCLAKDGHACLSLGEKTIDDFLYSRNVPHKKEPAYPEGRFRADFSVGRVFIEYFGLAGATEYDLKTKEKQRLCRKHRIKLISIYPEDLVSTDGLESKLKKLISS